MSVDLCRRCSSPVTPERIATCPYRFECEAVAEPSAVSIEVGAGIGDAPAIAVARWRLFTADERRYIRLALEQADADREVPERVRGLVTELEAAS